MYFSLITPAPGREREAAHEWVSNAYGEHQWLWRFFPAPEGTARDFLFRRRDLDGLPRFYVVSKRPPQPQDGAWRMQTRDYQPRLAAGVRLAFELRANPVVARSSDGKARRHDVVMDEKKRLLQARGLERWDDWRAGLATAEGDRDGDARPALYELVQRTCTAWLKSRAEGGGFALDESGLIVDAYQQHGGKRGQLRFSSVDFAGHLTVTDPLRFAEVLAEGIGRAKAFGCGLLLVKPAV